MLLRDLTIENFRSFDKYQLNGLARVNLLVGDNNCGKTSVLEAACLLASEGDIHLMNHLLELREDTNYAQDPGAAVPRQKFGAISLLHRKPGFDPWLDPEDNPMVTIHGNLSQLSKRSRTVAVEFGREDTIGTGTFEDADQLGPTLKVTFSESNEPDRIQETRLAQNGLTGGPVTSGRKVSLHKTPPVLFVPAGGLETSQVVGAWSKLAKSRKEHHAVLALQLIDETITQIIPLPGATLRREVLIDRGDSRISLAELGGGAYSLLSLGCALGYTSGSKLFLDEIDTGLHYSRLKDMWRMVIKAAQELDVQVFATTHSLDCLNGLQDAIAADLDLAEHVSVHRIERAIKKAVSLSGEEFARAMLRESEIR